MKILKLKFKNINSLSGENEIDFTQPIFTNDGLFAITGKTGAGKSSILDAVTLALYGKTPRVEITGNENAVMTRGEKDCYSEITFEAAGKIWKSSWKQELNRNARLKPVNRMIADAEDKIIADQLRTCDLKIVEISGLTFEQFTKVILLAQGSFAAFLQANKNDKGELLEQITGTEIYGEISRKVYERNKTEKEKLEKIQIELDAIKLFSEDQINRITAENTRFKTEKNKLDGALEKTETAKKWLESLETLATQIKESKELLPALEESANTAKGIFDKAEKDLKKAKEEQENQKPAFNKVRELDTKISEKENSLSPINKAISDYEVKVTKLNAIIVNQNKKLEDDKKLLGEKELWAKQNKKYEALIPNYAAIEKENQLLLDSASEIKKSKSSLQDFKNNLAKKTEDVRNKTKIFENKEKEFNAKKTELDDKKSLLNKLLDGKKLSKLQNEKSTITEFGTEIKNLIEEENSIIKNEKEITCLRGKITRFNEDFDATSEKIESKKEKSGTLESKITLLTENINLSKTIHSLEEHRNNLKDGEECPLCGSLEHPFALGNVPIIGEKEKDLTDCKKQYSELVTSINNDEISLAKLNSDRENTIANKSKTEKLLTENREKQKEIIENINRINPSFSIPVDKDKVEKLKEILDQKRKQLISLNSIIEQAEETEKEIAKIRDNEIPALTHEKQEAEKAKDEAVTHFIIAENNYETKKSAADLEQEKHDEKEKELSDKFQIYDVENITDLKKCLDDWVENKNKSDALTTSIAKLSGELEVNKTALQSIEESLQFKIDEKNTVKTEKNSLEEERGNLFGKKSVEEEEIRLKNAIDEAELEREKAEKEKNKTNTEQEKTDAILKRKETEFAELQEQKTTDKSKEDLEIELTDLKEKAEEISRKIGANSQMLKTNGENQQNFGKRIKEKEKQEKQYQRWSKLNELIGSSDGKKYRNFAQALTFEHLIALANLQLQKMSDRYVLKRTGDLANPFELSVIDNYQNSEERTAQNLSGGEKFIVSLSLALGLANMASKNMSIDTMFIDEGFGTLDSDYLDVALNALSNLQSEGKIIGVISHLTELKERIATHIEIVPSGNGRSKIQIAN